MADLLLKGGEVSDLSQNVRAMLDVAVTDGVISAVAPDIDPSGGRGLFWQHREKLLLAQHFDLHSLRVHQL